jgi:tetratricopeptide (TPR) repeat protein/predicted Ser/Thr protein kinase
MECLDEDTVLALADGLPSGRERERIDRHVDGCPRCRELLADVMRLETPAGEAAATAVRIGTAIDHYALRRWLGSGTTAAVYAAFDNKLEREVALKLFHADEAGDAAGKLASSEAQALARLHHPHVLTVHAVGTYDGRPYLVTELIDGVSLRQWVVDRRPPWRRLLRTLIEAGEGLAAAHDAGVVHRDFKPDNVIIAQDARPIVVDFGFARLREQTIADVAGTPAYMAPEQLAGRADAKSDQFAFARVASEALGSSWGAQPRGVPRGVRRALRRGFADAPDERFPDLRALLAALARATRRRRLAMAATFAAVGVSVAATIGYAVADPRPELERAVRATQDGLDPWRALEMLALARAALESGQPALAAVHTKSAETILARVDDAAPQMRADLHNTRGKVAYSEGEFEAALHHAEQAIAICRESGDPCLSKARFNAGSILQSMGREREALAVFEAARVEMTNELGADHADVGRVWHSIGAAHNALGAGERALAAYDHALAILEPSLGVRHVDTLKAIFGRGNALLGLGRVEDALASYETCVAALGGDQPPPLLVFCLDSQAKAYAELGRMREAGNVWRRAYGLVQSRSFAKQPIRATIPFSLAGVDLAEGDRTSALALMLDARTAAAAAQWDATALQKDIEAWLAANASDRSASEPPRRSR